MSDPFAKPPAEVTRYLKSKGVRESFDWRDFSFDEHATAFTVAKSTGYDILADIKGALDQAIENREEFEAFRDRLRPILQEKGWWGRKLETDPATGVEREVQLGSSRRLRTIFWANTRTAYGAGQWERAQRTKRVLPYFIYVESTASHKRELHMTWVGTIVPIDDPWVDTHYPPSAWGCMCRFRQISEFEARRAGYDPEAPLPDAGLSYSFVNKRTGEVSRVPLGVDPGWGTNPGKTRFENVSKLLAGKLDAMDQDARRIAVDDLTGSWLARRIAKGDIPYDPASLDPANIARGKLATPIAAFTDAQAKRLGLESRTLSLSVADAVRINAAHPNLPENWTRQIQSAIDAGALLGGGAGLFETTLEDGSRVTLRRNEDGALAVAEIGPPAVD